MSASTLTVYRCDRCKHQVTVDDTSRREGWGLLAAHSVTDRARIGSENAGDDLCPGCLAALFEWFADRSEPVEQPAVPPRTPRSFTIEDRRDAVDLAGSLIREQAVVAIEFMRQQPTAILSGEILPGVFLDADARAERLVDAIVLRLKSGATTPSSGERPVSLPLTDPDAPAVLPADVSAPEAAQSRHQRSRPKPEHNHA